MLPLDHEAAPDFQLSERQWYQWSITLCWGLQFAFCIQQTSAGQAATCHGGFSVSIKPPLVICKCLCVDAAIKQVMNRSSGCSVLVKVK
jgi:hypothetical protein